MTDDRLLFDTHDEFVAGFNRVIGQMTLLHGDNQGIMEIIQDMKAHRDGQCGRSKGSYAPGKFSCMYLSKSELRRYGVQIDEA